MFVNPIVIASAERTAAFSELNRARDEQDEEEVNT
jgi:hypothetical protein